MRTQPLFQGRDWFSENRTAAQTYRALDKIHDLCQHQMKGPPSSLFKSRLPLLSVLMDHIDMLQKGILHLIEEKIPSGSYVHDAQTGWHAFELRELEKELSEGLTDLSDPESTRGIKKMMSLTLTIKEHIRKIDQ